MVLSLFVRGGFIMSDQAIDFLFLSEEDMIRAGVKDMPACIEAMEEVLKCLMPEIM